MAGIVHTASLDVFPAIVFVDQGCGDLVKVDLFPFEDVLLAFCGVDHRGLQRGLIRRR